MRRLISMLAAGVLAAGTLFATAGVASAGAAAARKAPCTPDGTAHITITKSGVNYHVGTPNTTFNGATVRLRKGLRQGEWAALLAARNVKYVLLTRDLDWQAYSYLDSQPDLTQIGDFGSIVLYRNQMVE